MLGALAGNEGTALGGMVGGGADSFFAALRNQKGLNANNIYQTGFAQMLRGGAAGFVGGLVNEFSGGVVDLISKKGNCSCGK